MRHDIITPRYVAINAARLLRDPREQPVHPSPVYDLPTHLMGEGRDPVAVARARAAQRTERCAILTALYRDDLEGFDAVLAQLHGDDPDIWHGLEGRAWARAAVRYAGEAR